MEAQLMLLRQLDKQLSKIRKIVACPPPKKGWINAIRTTLGLSSYRLAEKIGVNQSRVIQIEMAEKNKSITLKTLEKTAHALDCQLVYALVPKTSLKNVLEKRAKELAIQKIKRVSHSMALESQLPSVHEQKQQYRMLVKRLLEGSPKKLWEIEK